MSDDKGSRNRGHAASVGRGGDARGSGAGAGGGGPEELDTDPQAGGGKTALPITKPNVSPTHN